MSPPVKGVLPLGGGHEILPRGSLGVSEPREQFVVRSIPGAFGPDGALTDETLRSLMEKVLRDNAVPDRLPLDTPAGVHSEGVVWGGNIMDRYGHFLVETVSRLWPVLPGAELEGLPVVFTTPRNPPFVGEWLAAFGAQTVELPEDGAVRFERMYIPEPAWRLGRWIAPELRDIHLQARRGMSIPPAPRHDVLWLSRSRLVKERVAYDERLLEWLLGDRVTPVHLETMTLAEQVGLLESSRAVAGISGSAFHTLLLTVEPPDCLYLSPSMDRANYATQHRLMETEATFELAVASTMRMRRTRQRTRIFPGGYRVLIPEALRAFESSVLPTLLEDPRLAAFAHAGAGQGGGTREALGDDLDEAVMRILLEPFSFDARMTLGALFEERGLTRCALEQYAMVADLSDDVAEQARATERQAPLESQCA